MKWRDDTSANANANANANDFAVTLVNTDPDPVVKRYLFKVNFPRTVNIDRLRDEFDKAYSLIACEIADDFGLSEDEVLPVVRRRRVVLAGNELRDYWEITVTESDLQEATGKGDYHEAL